MKKGGLVLLLIITYLGSQAQSLLKNTPKGFEIVVSGSFDYSNRIFEGYDEYAEKFLINKSIPFRTHVWAYSGSLQMHKPLSDRLYFIQGVTLSKRGEHTPVFKGWISGNQVIQTNDTTTSITKLGISYNYEYYFIELPAMMSYHFGRNPRSTFYIQGGFSPDIIFRDKTTVFVHDLKENEVTKPIKEKNFKVKMLFVHGIAGFGWRQRIGQRMGFLVGPEFKYYFISPHSPDKRISETQMGKLFSAGINLGLTF